MCDVNKAIAMRDTENLDASGRSLTRTMFNPHVRRPVPMTYVITRDDFFQDKYKMDYPKRGFAVIINNKDFDAKPTRKGTDKDASALYNRLNELKFDISRSDNLTVQEMHDLLNEMAFKDHNDCDCFFLAILTHGEEDMIYGTDGVVKVADVMSYFKGKNCPSLTGKPKIFLFQACRGEEYDDGTCMVVTDARADMEVEQTLETVKIPSEADCLVLYSVVSGFYCWRNRKNGSWFIQAISRCLMECDLAKEEFVRVMTKVNRIVAYDFMSNTLDSKTKEKKQIPCITSMLTKDLFFPQKL